MKLFSAVLLVGTLIAIGLLILTVKAESCQQQILDEVSTLVERREFILGDDWVDGPEGVELVGIGARLGELPAAWADCVGQR